MVCNARKTNKQTNRLDHNILLNVKTYGSPKRVLVRVRYTIIYFIFFSLPFNKLCRVGLSVLLFFHLLFTSSKSKDI